MSQYNIEMNSYDGNVYNQLYPQTLLNNVTDWNNSIYNKSQVDNLLNNKVDVNDYNSEKMSWKYITTVSVGNTASGNFTLNNISSNKSHVVCLMFCGLNLYITAQYKDDSLVIKTSNNQTIGFLPCGNISPGAFPSSVTFINSSGNKVAYFGYSTSQYTTVSGFADIIDYSNFTYSTSQYGLGPEGKIMIYAFY